MAITVDIQVACEDDDHPPPEHFDEWVKAAVAQEKNDAEVAIRLVDENEITELNNTYRGKNTATNVLSFPADLPDAVNIPLLGDLIICTPVVNQEAKDQRKKSDDHWAHMTIHGILHLLGYDHIDDKEADIMEALEIKLLANLNIANPYISNHSAQPL